MGSGTTIQKVELGPAGVFILCPPRVGGAVVPLGLGGAFDPPRVFLLGDCFGDPPRAPPFVVWGVGRVFLFGSRQLGNADWQERGTRRQLVGQAEILPVVLSQELWRLHLCDRRVIVFIDNDAARHAVIRGASPSGPSAVLVSLFWANEALLGSFCWVERVPTQSNPADGPSRLRFDLVRKIGVVVHEENEVLQLPCVGRVVLG